MPRSTLLSTLSAITLILIAPLLSACGPTQRFTVENHTTAAAAVRAVPARSSSAFSGTEAWCMDVVKPGTRLELEYNQRNSALKQPFAPAIFTMQIGPSKASTQSHWLLLTKESCQIVISPDQTISVTDVMGNPVGVERMETSPWEEWMFRMFN